MGDAFDARLRDALRRRAGQAPDAAAVEDVLADTHRRARRRQRRQRVAGALVAVAILGVGAVAATQLVEPGSDVVLAPGDPEPSADERQPAPDRDAQLEDGPAPEVDASCQGSEHGISYRLSYPESWWASDGTDAEACRWFHPEPFDMPDQPRDVPELAIMVRVVDRSFDEARELGEDSELRSERETVLDGRPALAQEYVVQFDGIYPEGTTFYRYLVDVDGYTLYATTADGDIVEADYEESRRVLGAMMRSLEIVDRDPSEDEDGDAATCSAQGEAPPSEPAGDLPRPVAELRQAIAEAAISCDYDRLAELAGDEFTYSFGGGGDFAGHLRRGEQQGSEPLRHLAGLLDRPHAATEDRPADYVWPSAFAFDSWADVPAEDREALKPLYDEEDFEQFETFGGYIGYRIGITEDGRWLYFVAGD